MSAKKAGAGSRQQWEMELSGEVGGSEAFGGGKRGGGGRLSGGGRGWTPSKEEMEAMLLAQVVRIEKRISQMQRGLEDAFRIRFERSGAASGGPLKEMLASVEKMAKEWKAATPEEGGEETKDRKDSKDTKEAKDSTERTRAAALMKVIEEFAGRVRTLHADVEKARNAQRKSVSVAAVTCVLLAAPVLFGIGLVVQQELTVLPEPERVAEADPDAEWRTYVWRKYGPGIKECEREAVNRGAPVRCELRMTP